VIESVDDNRTQLRYRVHMEFTMPAGVVIVGLDHPSNGVHEDIYVAIRNGFGLRDASWRFTSGTIPSSRDRRSLSVTMATKGSVAATVVVARQSLDHACNDLDEAVLALRTSPATM